MKDSPKLLSDYVTEDRLDDAIAPLYDMVTSEMQEASRSEAELQARIEKLEAHKKRYANHTYVELAKTNRRVDELVKQDGANNIFNAFYAAGSLAGILSLITFVASHIR